MTDRAYLRGRDVREALRGERPLKRPAASMKVARRTPRFVLLVVLWSLLALAFYFTVGR